MSEYYIVTFHIDLSVGPVRFPPGSSITTRRPPNGTSIGVPVSDGCYIRVPLQDGVEVERVYYEERRVLVYPATT